MRSSLMTCLNVLRTSNGTTALCIAGNFSSKLHQAFEYVRKLIFA
jgi:hypothetical protein